MRLPLKLAVPALDQQTRWVERTVYHLDGPGAIRHLDALLSLPELDANANAVAIEVAEKGLPAGSLQGCVRVGGEPAEGTDDEDSAEKGLEPALRLVVAYVANRRRSKLVKRLLALLTSTDYGAQTAAMIARPEDVYLAIEVEEAPPPEAAALIDGRLDTTDDVVAAAPRLTAPRGSSRSRVRGLAASMRWSTRRLNVIAAVRAAIGPEARLQFFEVGLELGVDEVVEDRGHLGCVQRRSPGGGDVDTVGSGHDGCSAGGVIETDQCVPRRPVDALARLDRQLLQPGPRFDQLTLHLAEPHVVPRGDIA